MKRVLTLTILFVGISIHANAAWYSPNWRYRIPVYIYNASTSAAVCYYANSVTLKNSNYTSFMTHAKANGADLFMTASDGVTPLTFWLESISTQTFGQGIYIEVKVPYIAAMSTYTAFAYYGNSAAVSVSSAPLTIQPSTTVPRNVDVYNQLNSSGGIQTSKLIYLQHQTGNYAGYNGMLISIASVGGTGNNSGLNIGMATSTNLGGSWTLTTILHGNTDFLAMPRSLTELASGELVLAYGVNYATATGSKGDFAFLSVAVSTTAGTSWVNLSTNVATNSPIPMRYTYTATDGSIYGKIMEPSAGGDLFVPIWNGGPNYPANAFASLLYKCPSGADPTVGSNWVFVSTIGFDGLHGWNETDIIYPITSTSTFIAVMRDNNGNGRFSDLWKVVSLNSGSTWGTPTRMQIPNTINNNVNIPVSPNLTLLQDGNILLAFGKRYGTADGAPSGGFFGISSLMSTDNGSSFGTSPPIQLYSSGPVTGGGINGGNFCYPWTVQLANGNIFMTYYYANSTGTNLNLSNIGSIYTTEDYLFNGANLYEPCESFTSNISNHQSDVTLDSTLFHSGSHSYKASNEDGAGGGYFWVLPWETMTTQHANYPGKFSHSHWIYITAIQSQFAANFSYGMNSYNATAAANTDWRVDHFSTNSVVSISYRDTSNSTINTFSTTTTGVWMKDTTAIDFTTSTVTGQIFINNTKLPFTIPNSTATMTVPINLMYYTGSFAGGPNTCLVNYDDIYTEQYYAVFPVDAEGPEQMYDGGRSILMGH